MNVTRRELLGGMGSIAVVLATARCAGADAGAATDGTSKEANAVVPVMLASTVPWQYTKLDMTAVSERGYAAYSQGGCMYGAFEGLVGELRAKVGSPYDAFPTAMMKYGKAGVAGWGTLCGALNGAAAAIYLVAKADVADTLIHSLYTWYGYKPLPSYTPKAAKFTIATSTSNSPLCHVSVTTWCEATGLKALSAERAERCAQLTASVAGHTAELLNDMVDGKIAAPAVVGEVATCLACHGKGGAREDVHASRGNSCSVCHGASPHKL